MNNDGQSGALGLMVSGLIPRLRYIKNLTQVQKYHENHKRLAFVTRPDISTVFMLSLVCPKEIPFLLPLFHLWHLPIELNKAQVPTTPNKK